MKGEIKITLEADSDQIDKATEIFTALIKSGGLWGVKGGQTIIHFDSDGVFQGIQFSYWPWRRRKK
jgi:hypothetical protein